jgi:hypothetical protein
VNIDEKFEAVLAEVNDMASALYRGREASGWASPDLITNMAGLYNTAENLVGQLADAHDKSKAIFRRAIALHRTITKDLPGGGRRQFKRRRLVFVSSRCLKVAQSATLMAYWEIATALEAPPQSRSDFDRRVAAWTTFLRDQRARPSIK